MLQREFLPFAPMFLGACLKSQAQPQTDGPAIVNTLVGVTLLELPEFRVGFDVGNRQQSPRRWIHVQKEHPKVSKVKRCVRISRRTQWVVENVVEISTHFKAGAFVEMEPFP
jgi:hypothetical protein